ncbi:HEPN-associated N-terminal domain-containing protein [Arthrobacter sp. TMT4-20]
MGIDNELEAQEERGWYEDGTIVCTDCITEQVLAQALRDQNTKDVCSYCGRTPSAAAASGPIEVVLPLIVNGLRHEYEAPVEALAYDGEWVGAVYELSDLLWDFEVTERESVHEALCDLIPQEQWCQRDPYASSPTEALKWGWNAFRDFVREHKRLPRAEDSAHHGLGAGEIAKHDMPGALIHSVSESGLIRTLPVSTEWWRIRVHNPGERHTSAAAIGTPPNQYAKHNRMSPKGMGAFYGASTREGPRAEVAGYADPTDEGTVGLFKTTRALDVLDLTDLPAVPSLFDSKRRHLRAPIAFLTGFVEDITEVAHPSDEEKRVYIPTQKVADLFRTRITGKVSPLTGILWRSSQNASVISCVLFISSTEVADAGKENGTTKLSLDPTSVETLAAPL